MGCSKPKCCFIADRVGCVGEGEARSGLLGCDMCLMVVALIMSIIAIVGMSSDKQTVKNVPWTQVEFKNPSNAYGASVKLDVDMNLWGVVVSPGNNDFCEYYGCTDWNNNGWCDNSIIYAVDMCVGVSWDDLDKKQPTFSDCYNVPKEKWSTCVARANGTTYYEDCKDASKGVAGSVITGLVTSIITLISRCTCNNRFDYETDMGKKLILLISTILPVITSIAAVAEYAAACNSKVNDFYDVAPEGATYDVNLGPGYICMTAGLAMNLVAFMLQCIVKGNTGTNKDEPKMTGIEKTENAGNA